MMTDMQVMTIENSAAVTLVDNNPFSSSIFKAWIDFCDVQPATQKTYNKAIENFADYLRDNNIARPTRETVIAYREHLLSNGYKVSSARLYMTVTKNFFRFLSSNSIYPNVADGVKLPAMPTDEHARDALTLDEAKATLKSFKGTDEKSLRDKAIMSMMIGCGLRSVEIVRADVGDIEKRRGQWFIRVHGKARAGKTDDVKISNELKKIIDDYLAVRKHVKKSDPLFVSTAIRNRGERLQTQTVSRLAKKTFASIGIESDRVTCHSCRHTFAALSIDNGVPMRELQKILRHRSIVTTEVYMHDRDKFKSRGVEIVSKVLFAA